MSRGGGGGRGVRGQSAEGKQRVACYVLSSGLSPISHLRQTNVSPRHGEEDNQGCARGLKVAGARIPGAGWRIQTSSSSEGLVLSDLQAVQVLLGQVIAETILLLQPAQILTGIIFHINTKKNKKTSTN